MAIGKELVDNIKLIILLQWTCFAFIFDPNTCIRWQLRTIRHTPWLNTKKKLTRVGSAFVKPLRPKRIRWTVHDTESSVSLLAFIPHPISPTLRSRLHGYGHMFEQTSFFTYSTRLHGTMQILLQIAILSTVQKHVQFYGYRVNERRIRASFCQFKGSDSCDGGLSHTARIHKRAFLNGLWVGE